MLTFKPMYSILCGLSIIAPSVLPLPQPQGYSPPGSFVALLCCCGLPRLIVMLDGRCSTVAGSVFRCSVQELLDLCCYLTPGSITGIGSLSLLRHPRCVHGASRHKCVHMDGAIPSVRTDRRSIYSLSCLLHFVKCWDDKRGLHWGSWLLVSGF